MTNEILKAKKIDEVNERLVRQQSLFGMFVEDMEEDRKESLMTDIMYAISLLSDAQELMEMNGGRYSTPVRHTINQAKYFMNKRHKEDREKEISSRANS